MKWLEMPIIDSHQQMSQPTPQANFHVKCH